MTVYFGRKAAGVTLFGANGASTLDLTPDAFSFAAASGAGGALVVAAPITISGVSPDVDVGVSVATPAEWSYSADAGSTWSSWTSSPGVVRLNYQVRLRGPASNTAGATVNFTLTVGGVTGAFPVTTSSSGAISVTGAPGTFRRGSTYTLAVDAGVSLDLDTVNVTLGGAPLTVVSVNGLDVEVSTSNATPLLYSTSGYPLTVTVDAVGSATVASQQFLPPSGYAFVSLSSPDNSAGTLTYNMTVNGVITPAITNDQIEYSEEDLTGTYPIVVTAGAYPRANVSGADFVSLSFSARHIPSAGAGAGVPGAFATFMFSQAEDTATRPNPLFFYSVSGQAVNATVISNAEKITGVSPGIDIPVTVVNGLWQKSINDGATWTTWSTNPGTVQADDLVRVQGTSPAQLNDVTFVDLLIGGEQAVFSISTALGNDFYPDPVAFGVKLTTTASAVVESDPVTFTGMTPGVNVPVVCSSGLSFRTSQNGGSTWSSWSSNEATGSIQNGWQVQLRLTGPNTDGQRDTAAFFVGTVPHPYTVVYNSDTAIDYAPTPFTLGTVNNQVPGTWVESSVITVAGLGLGVSTVFTATNGQWRKSTDGGTTWNDWTTYPTEMLNGVLFQVRAVAPQPGYTSANMMVSLGTYNTVFSVTSQSVNDTTPDLISFTPANNQTASTLAASSVGVITGVTAGVDIPVTVTGGSWRRSTDGGSTWGSYSTAPGVVRLNDRVQLQGTSSAASAGVVTVTLTVGGASFDFVITTETTIDATPDAFSFSAATGQDGGVLVVSSAVTVQGVTAATDVPVSVSGGSWRKSSDNGATWSAFSATSGVVRLNDQVQVQGTSSGTGGGTTNVTLTIGGVSAVFAIGTANDTTPSGFSFAAANNSSLNTVITSPTAQVSGVTAGINVPASVTGGEWRYSTDGGATWSAWGASDGSVRLNYLVQVRGTSSGTNSTTTTVIFTMGGISANFAITTAAVGQDTTPAAFSFQAVTNAQPNTMVTSNSVEVLAVTPGLDIPVTAVGGQWRRSTDGGTTWSSWGVASGVARLNDLLQLQVTSSTSASATVSATLTVGGVSAAFDVMTAAVSDVTPDAFSFSDVSDRPAGALEVSSVITISGTTAGIDVPASVTGGEWRYSTNSGASWSAWSAGAGHVRSGYQVQVRGYASNTSGGTADVTFTAGGVSDTFTIGTAIENDTTPTQFSFQAVNNAALNAVRESNSVQILGITAGVDTAVSIAGGEWRRSTDGGTTWSAYGTSAGVVRLNDLVQVRGTASGVNSNTVVVTLTVGGVPGVFSITTVAADDTIPNAIQFAPIIGAALDTLVESAEAQITGVSVGVNVPASVVGGEWRYSADGGTTWSAWSATAGNVQLNYRVQLRLTSSAINGATSQAVLTVGGVQAAFAVTTLVAAGTILPPPGRTLIVGQMQGFSIATGEWQSPNMVTKPQAAGERLDYAFNFHNTMLQSQDAIATFEMLPSSGLQITGANLAALGTFVVFWLEGAQPGNTYTVSCRVTTTYGRVIKASFRVMGIA